MDSTSASARSVECDRAQKRQKFAKSPSRNAGTPPRSPQRLAWISVQFFGGSGRCQF